MSGTRAGASHRTRTAVRWLKSLALPLAVFLVLKTFVFEAFHIYPSGSMEGTLLIGDFLFVNKALYGAEIPIVHKRLPALRDPERFDVVVFRSVEDARLTVVKRVVGVPGDTLEMRHGDLWINGSSQPEPYVQRGDQTIDPVDRRMRYWQRHYLTPESDPGGYHPSLRTWGPIVVPADSFFVMGDNRGDSYDSRYWGYLGRDRIKGSPFLVYYSYDRNGGHPFPFLTSIRWRRLLTVPN